MYVTFLSLYLSLPLSLSPSLSLSLSLSPLLLSICLSVCISLRLPLCVSLSPLSVCLKKTHSGSNRLEYHIKPFRCAGMQIGIDFLAQYFFGISPPCDRWILFNRK